MEQRKFILKTWEDVDWEISLVGVEEGNEKNIDIDAFAITKQNKDGITYLFDIAVQDKDLELASKNKMFLEECLFTHTSYDGSKNIKQFEGSFIDALQYIQKEFLNE